VVNDYGGSTDGTGAGHRAADDVVDEIVTAGGNGPRDYNAWLGKITCERLHNGLDATADKSAHFALINLPRDTTTGQSYQFLAAAIGTYCRDQVPVLTAVAARHE
jgi:Protein of unknown function (DUF732)